MDLFEVTENVCLPIIIGILTIAFPLLLQSISRIDEKYSTSVLTKRFKKENIYCVFQWILYISLGWVFYHFILAQYSHWTPDTSAFMNRFMPYSSSILLISLTITLIVILILLIRRIMFYYDHSELLDEEIQKFEGFDNMTGDDYDVFAFVLNYNICLNADISGKNAKKVYDILSNYANKIYEKGNEFHNSFFFLIEQLNEKLCQQKQLNSINTKNTILKLLLPTDSSPKDTIISEKTYAWLFSFLRTQLNYGKTDWVYEYWQSANQYRNFNIILPEDSRKVYNDAKEEQEANEKIKKNSENNQNFEEFHIWLGNMVLYKKEYVLLGKMLSPDEGAIKRYPLIPSTLYAILKYFGKIYREMDANIFAYSSYSFSDTYWISKSDIHHRSVIEFLALLLLRLNSATVTIMNGRAGWIKPQKLYDLQELYDRKEHIEVLLRFVKEWNKNREHEAFKALNIVPEIEEENNPIQKLYELIKDIETKIEELKQEENKQ